MGWLRSDFQKHFMSVKVLLGLIVAVLIAGLAVAQIASYGVSTIPLANSIPATSTNAFPIVLTTTYVTNIGTTQISYNATNTVINSNYFTLPTNVWLNVTNTFIRSNTVAGTNVLTFIVLESIHNTNSDPYYVTNVSHSTNIITTNYQFFNYSTGVPYTITGTSRVITTNIAYGGAVVDVSRSANAVLTFGFKNTGGGDSANVVLRFQPSPDGVSTNTGNPQSITLAANGTSAVSTNVALATPMGFLILETFENANTNALTNIVFKVSQRIQAP